VANGIHTLMDVMQPSGRHSPIDDLSIEIEGGKLKESHDAMLSRCEIRDHTVRPPPTGRFPSI